MSKCICIHPSVLWFIGNFFLHLPSVHPLMHHPSSHPFISPPLLLRFVHELQYMHSTTTDRCNQVTAALKRVRQAREKVEALERKVGKERVVLGEKSEACEQLLVQVGQDTAISQEHSKLAAKQRSRITHLQRVSCSEFHYRNTHAQLCLVTLLIPTFTFSYNT